MVYGAMVHSHLTYGTEIWYNMANKKEINKLTILQKRAIRTLSNSEHLAHTEPLFKELNILNLEQLQQFFQLSLAQSLYYKTAPIALRQLVPPSEGRASANKHLKVNYNAPHNVLLKLIPSLWNSVEPSLRSIESRETLKKHIKKALVGGALLPP